MCLCTYHLAVPSLYQSLPSLEHRLPSEQERHQGAGRVLRVATGVIAAAAAAGSLHPSPAQPLLRLCRRVSPDTVQAVVKAAVVEHVECVRDWQVCQQRCPFLRADGAHTPLSLPSGAQKVLHEHTGFHMN